MSKTVFRIAKLKSPVAIRASASHNDRSRPCPNVDPNGSIVLVKHPPKGVDAYQAVLNTIGDQTIRKNAVLAVEVLISASPEYFRPDGNTYGEANAERLGEWREATEKWIAQEFPHAVSVALHLDEATPHYHVLDVPLVDTLNKKTGEHFAKLGADKKYGGRKELSEWQTKCANAVAHLGIERGVERSIAKHQTIRQYYNQVNAAPAIIPEITTPAPSPFDKSKYGVLDFKQKAEDKAKAEEQVKKRNVEKQKRYMALEAEFPKALAKAQMWEMASRTQDLQQQKIKRLESDLSAYKASLENLRVIPLTEIIEGLYGLPENKDSRPKYKTRQFDFNGSTIGVTDEKFIVNATGKGGRGAIDLVMAIDGCEFKQAIKILSDFYGQADTVKFVKANSAIENTVKKAVSTPAYQPKPEPTKWAGVRDWFINVRGMPSKLIDTLHQKGLIYADNQANAVFLRENGGAFLRGTYGENNTFKRTYGNAECGTFHIGSLDGKPSNELILVEGPIDALAAKAAFPDATIKAVGGNLVALDKIDTKGLPVRTAFDRDAKGESLLAKAKELWSTVEPVLFGKFKDIAEAVKNGTNWVSERWLPPQGTDGAKSEAAPLGVARATRPKP